MARNFDGVDDIINCGSDASIDDIFSGGGVVHFVINPDSDGEANLGRVFEKRDATNGYDFDTKDESGGNIRIRLFINLTHH